MPTKNRPSVRSTSRPRRGVAQDRNGEGDQYAGEAIEQHRPGRPEQPGETGGEDPAESLTENPDDQSPRHAGQARQPRQVPPGRREQPHADADLDPDR